VIAKRFGISADKVRLWIERGELRGVNVATTAGGRPRYVVDVADLAVFEERRAAQGKRATVPRRRKTTAGIIEFF
jgi:transposase